MSTKGCFLSLFTSILVGLAAPAAEIRGVIVKADADKNQLTIEGRGLGVRGVIMTFRLDKDAQIRAGRNPAKVADLSPGRRVRVTYDVEGGQHVALLITLLGGQPNSAPPTGSASSSADSLSGTLRRISFTDREIVVISPGSKGGAEVETTLSVPEDAKISKDQKAISFDELKEGDQVLVQVEKRDGKLVARSIQSGATAETKPNAEPGQNKIEQLRKALKLIDFLLQMMDQKPR